MAVAREVLRRVPLAGRVVTGDALHCQRATCQLILDAGGDYLFVVKEHQPRLHGDSATLFFEPPPGERFARATQRSRHGDRREMRRLWAPTALTDCLDWPGARQVARIERIVTQQGATTTHVRSLSTSLPAAVGAARLLALKRGHWAIENRLHYPRDQPFGEGAGRIRTGAAPQVMAALRNTVLNLLRYARVTAITATRRALGWSAAAVRFLGCDRSRKSKDPDHGTDHLTFYASAGSLRLVQGHIMPLVQ